MGCILLATNVAKLWRRTFLKFFQHDIKSGILKYEVYRMIVELADCVKRCSVIGINKCQIFNIE